MDYGKYVYMQKKNQRKNSSHKNSLKEIKVRVNIADHDISYKRKRIVEFLTAGHKVKITVCFHGRELSHKELGDVVLRKMLDGIEAHGKIESPAKMEGSNLSAIVVSV